jgi:electron transport complex protein RnfE
MCVVREFLGNGTFGGGILGADGGGIQILPESLPAMMMILPVGGFLTLGVLIALVQYFLTKKKGGAEK